MKIPCPDGDVYLRPKEGGLMGDSNEPEAFMANYHLALDAYRIQTHKRIAKPLIAEAEWLGAKVDAGIGTFLDDVLRTVTAEGGDARTLPGLCNHDANHLDEALTRKGYAQNHSKAEITRFAPRSIKRQLYDSPTLKGKIMPNLLHLGAIIACAGATGPEVNRSLASINTSWAHFKHFWSFYLIKGFLLK